jgi:TolA-binding protein
MENTPHACAESKEALLFGTSTAEAEARVVAHRLHCAGCQLSATRAAEVNAGLRGVDASLDDMTRARIFAKLGPAIDELAAQAARPVWRWRWPSVGVGALIATLTCAAAVVVWTRVSPSVDLGAVRGADSAAVATVTPASIEPVLRPDQGRPVARLDVPSGQRVRARLGAQARIALLGPGAVRVTSSSSALTELGLDSGTLVIDYDRQKGGALRIASLGIVTEVVGTLLSVEVHPGGSRVSVAHGTVKVTDRKGDVQFVRGGETWTSDTEEIAPLDPGSSRRFEDDLRDEPALAPVRSTPPVKPTAPARTLPAKKTVVRAAKAARAMALNETSGSMPKAIPAETSVRPAPSAAVSPPPSRPSSPAVSAGPSAVQAPTAERFYANAEAALRRRDDGEARFWLNRLRQTFPASPLADPAQYELAQLALSAGDLGTAARVSDGLIATVREPSLRAPVRYLRCRIEAEQGNNTTAVTCLERFRQDFPRASQDEDALALLLGQLTAESFCGARRRSAEEYLSRYRNGKFTAEIARRLGRCAAR